MLYSQRRHFQWHINGVDESSGQRLVGGVPGFGLHPGANISGVGSGLAGVQVDDLLGDGVQQVGLFLKRLSIAARYRPRLMDHEHGVIGHTDLIAGQQDERSGAGAQPVHVGNNLRRVTG